MPGLIWFGLLIPVLLSFVLLAIPSLRKMTKWWELAIPFAVTVITVLICQSIMVSAIIILIVNIAAGAFVVYNPWYKSALTRSHGLSSSNSLSSSNFSYRQLRSHRKNKYRYH